MTEQNFDGSRGDLVWMQENIALAVRWAEIIESMESTPPQVSGPLVKGVRRPVEDLVVWRDESGYARAVAEARASVRQAARHLHRAMLAAAEAEAAYGNCGDRHSVS
ncbi:hypothetical protein EV193_104392 [Herbihabitans rhizosphaerae]|uniref:Uncharacterized protein n=1 Tax=Herbihabitans rhizosphaerae TaxID=1872711 RepID=A0A4Q7KRY1_9PSEU|nr:hypothetical protein [Herbihabitans rhizosphaerae]RZS39176.1 hypothetical protein EV193_104392 [Herbihabitans rhizosphaerae]